MKGARSMTIGAVICLLLGTGATLFGQAAAQATGDAPNSLVEYTQGVLARLARSPSIIKYLEGQNGRRVTIAQLKALDAKWKAAPGVESFMWDLLRNKLAWELVDFQYRNKFIVEIFAMDSRGAIVAETNRTSSYYKGEAAKFTAAFANGTGAVWFGPVEFDESTAEMVIQVSVPVMKGSKAIGAICFGVSLDRWEERR